MKTEMDWTVAQVSGGVGDRSAKSETRYTGPNAMPLRGASRRSLQPEKPAGCQIVASIEPGAALKRCSGGQMLSRLNARR